MDTVLIGTKYRHIGSEPEDSPDYNTQQKRSTIPPTGHWNEGNVAGKICTCAPIDMPHQPCFMEKDSLLPGSFAASGIRAVLCDHATTT